MGVKFFATLTSGGQGGQGVSGQVITIQPGYFASCTATTNASGFASCVLVEPTGAVLVSPYYTASYGGGAVYAPS
jgi:hypothetical protein